MHEPIDGVIPVPQTPHGGRRPHGGLSRSSDGDELGIDPSRRRDHPTVGYVDLDGVRAGMSTTTTTTMSQQPPSVVLGGRSRNLPDQLSEVLRMYHYTYATFPIFNLICLLSGGVETRRRTNTVNRTTAGGSVSTRANARRQAL